MSPLKDLKHFFSHDSNLTTTIVHPFVVCLCPSLIEDATVTKRQRRKITVQLFAQLKNIDYFPLILPSPANSEEDGKYFYGTIYLLTSKVKG